MAHDPVRTPLRALPTRDAALALHTARFPSPALSLVTLAAEEFTSLCPLTGQPDFGRVTIIYKPDAYCLESKSLKVYLWSYRDVGAYVETLAADIADDILMAIEPQELTVRVEQFRRGGIGIVAEARRGWD